MDGSLRWNSKWTRLYENDAVISIANTINFSGAGLMLSQRRRQRPKIKPTLFYFLMFAGMTDSQTLYFPNKASWPNVDLVLVTSICNTINIGSMSRRNTT